VRISLAFKILGFYFLGVVWGGFSAPIHLPWYWSALFGAIVGFFAVHISDDYE
jgi:hypothetical protein